MTTLDAVDIAEIESRYPDVFRTRPWKRFGALIGIAFIILYSVYCFWFFSIGAVLGRSGWDIAGSYLADWISYEVRPDIEIASDNTMSIGFPRFSPLGSDPHPAWIEAVRETKTRTIEVEAAGTAETVAEKNANSFMVPDAKGTNPEAQEDEGATDGQTPKAAPTTRTVTEEVVTSAHVEMGTAGTLDIMPEQVTVRRGEETFTALLRRGGPVTPETALPAWATQKYEGQKIVAWFGFAGRVEIDHDTIKIRRRFLGWENFVFDTNSPFWGKSAGEVLSLILAGERIDPGRSNLSLAWNNILYNAEWQHLDVWTKLLQTIIMAFVGTLFAAIIAFPLSFLAARNITRSRILNQINKRFFDFQRSVDMFIWALFFTRAFGPGPLAGISAIFFTDTGTLGKLYSEALENIDDRQREGVKSVGASPVMVQRYGVLPQVLPLFASQALYFWESNTRSATIIGAVGAGGIGLKLWEAMRTNQDWENVAYMVVLILAVVFVFDNISNMLRSRLMGAQR